MKKNHYQIHRDLLDIIPGYSDLQLNNKIFYFKHFSLEYSLELEALTQRDIVESERSGIKKRDQLLESAIKGGGWSNEKSEKIKSLQWMVKKSLAALEKMEDVNQRRVFHKQIKNQEDELQELEAEKNEIVKYSAEALAETKKIQRMMEGSCFLDSEFKKEVSKKIHDPLAPLIFSRYVELNNRDNLLMIAYHSGFFDIYATQSKNPLALFGATLRDLTVFQKNILIMTNSLLLKMQNTRIPDEIAGDPLKIYKYEEKEQSESNVSHGLDDLKAKTKARGGKLKAEDFLT